MKRILQFLFCAIGGVVAAHAQPVIASGGIYNAASYAYAGLPNSAIAQGSLFVVFGSNLGPGTLQSSALPLSSSFGGTSLTATVNGTVTKPLVVYTSAGQLAAVMPSNTPVGTGTLTVTYNGQTSASAPVTVAASSFGIFTINSAGSGPGIVTNAAYSVASLSSAANPGEVFIIWGTGLGPAVSGDESKGTGTVGTTQVQVFVGGVAATVSGYARSSCCGGLDQIAFTVPTGVAGCHVPVVVQIGSTVSNFVSMPIAATTRVCTDPSNTNITGLAQQGTVSTGSISLSRSSIALALPPPLPSTTSTTDTGSGSFVKYNYAQYVNAQNPLDINTFGACTVYTFKGTASTFTDPVQPTILDAGPSLTVNGPGGVKTLTKSNGFYGGTLGGGPAGLPGSTPLYLTQGQYTITGPGGADVGGFTASLTVPAPLVWTNASSITNINRASGQNITWTGGDPAGNVEIIGFATSGTSSTAVGAAFVCIQKTSAGSFNIPAPVLLSLPASAAASSLVPTGFLGVGFATVGTFTAKGLDMGTVSATGQTLQTVNYQ